MSRDSERDRIESLHTYGVTDAVPDVHLDTIATLAAQLAGTPSASLTFVDEDRVWVKAAYGEPHGHVPLEQMLCTTVVRTGETLAVEDLAAHPELHRHGAVAGPRRLRAYAGVPLIGRDALPLGALCVHSRTPQRFTPETIRALEMLAERVVAELELRRLDRMAGRGEAWRGVDVSAGRRLRRALDRGELVAYYQPLVELRTGAPRAFEALLRWEHPEQGLVGPAEFLPAVEGSGLLRPLERAVLQQSLATLAHAVREEPHPPALGIGVNVSAVHLGRRGFAAEVLAERERHDLSDGVLGIEVTETTDLLDSATARAELRTLRENGVSVALDDYGAGYSSLLRLLDLPISVLKLDRELVQRLPEDERQRDALVEAGCDFAQGLLYSPALNRRQLDDYLRHSAGDPWLDAPTDRAAGASAPHLAHCYTDAGELTDRVGAFLATSLLAGGHGRAVATEAHLRRIEADLARRGVDVLRAARGGRYVRVDADAIVREIDQDGSVGTSFVRNVLPALGRVGGAPLRVYGEVVAQLWRAGRTREALELEDLWNRAQRDRPFDLYCGYDSADLRDPGDLHAISSRHTHLRDTATA